MSAPLLRVHNVVNRFGQQVVHDGVSFEVARGEIIGIVGGSGSGKSVLLKTMLGLHHPNAGEVQINATPISAIPKETVAALIGVLFQEGALFSSMSTLNNIMLPMREHTALSQEEAALVAQLKLALVGLPPETGSKLPSELSGGMIKRSALARALALDPQILFLDEPTAGLDPTSAAAFDQLLLELNRALNVTVVMVTHDLDTVFTVCDRVAVLVDKKIIIDTLPNLLNNTHPWIQEYFHGPRGRAALMAAERTHGNG